MNTHTLTFYFIHYNDGNTALSTVLTYSDSLIACVSALYGKLLVVMGMAFPVAEVISHNIPISFYNGFYLYLYIGSIVFLVYAYLFLLQTINIPTSQLKSKFQTLRESLKPTITVDC
ncbi:hypothetical protein E2C01_092467 [Portunus trituberculatus]|uniref:Uncharacterized protein n=1 Tax=Portunus trituberculatus TaxID=210409 RepID=A0A5B7JQM9_PORTR|nr:hypothetical protein [Portunus trituberculatus]